MRREDRPVVLTRLTERIVARHAERGPDAMRRVIETSLESERDRLVGSSRSARDDADAAFVRGLAIRLRFTSDAGLPGMLGTLVDRYGQEIAGRFDPALYNLAARLLPPALAVLLTDASPSGLLARFPKVPSFDDRVRIGGASERTRELSERGTLVLCPTHSSNLDSIVLGLACHRVGLPPMVYGAGINLLENPLMSLFMYNFGAYMVDREKKDPLYREVLKEYTTLTLEAGYANLFFPGGTRSRSGALEQKLKLGLLGTTVPALRHKLRSLEAAPGIYVVPVTLSYELVLEAEQLIDEFLRRQPGDPVEVPDRDTDEALAPRVADFLDSLIELDSRIDVVFGEALDPLGHAIDEGGRSVDEDGSPVDLVRILERPDFDDAGATRRVGAALAGSYLRDNVAKPVHLVAKAVFVELLAREPEIDLRRGIEAGVRPRLPLSAVLSRLERVQRDLLRMAAAGRVRISPNAETAGPPELTQAALDRFDRFHRRLALARRDDALVVEDLALLLFYQNRLEGYGLERQHGVRPLLDEDLVELASDG